MYNTCPGGEQRRYGDDKLHLGGLAGAAFGVAAQRSTHQRGGRWWPAEAARQRREAGHTVRPPRRQGRVSVHGEE